MLQREQQSCKNRVRRFYGKTKNQQKTNKNYANVSVVDIVCFWFRLNLAQDIGGVLTTLVHSSSAPRFLSLTVQRALTSKRLAFALTLLFALHDKEGGQRHWTSLAKQKGTQNGHYAKQRHQPQQERPKELAFFDKDRTERSRGYQP